MFYLYTSLHQHVYITVSYRYLYTSSSCRQWVWGLLPLTGLFTSDVLVLQTLDRQELVTNKRRIIITEESVMVMRYVDDSRTYTTLCLYNIHSSMFMQYTQLYVYAMYLTLYGCAIYTPLHYLCVCHALFCMLFTLLYVYALSTSILW